jgi:hypothetical protein
MTCPVLEAGEPRLACGGSRLDLPLPTGVKESRTLPFEVRNRPASEPPARLPPVKKDRTGWRYAHEQPSFDHQVPDIGSRLTGGGWTDCQLRADRRSEWRVESWRGWSRGAWRCRIVAGCEVLADQQRFEVREYLRAWQGDTLIFEQDETAELPR